MTPVPAEERIGPYRVIREIGSGGMGNVYLAERNEGSQVQQVAIKRLKSGMDFPGIVQRFETERRLLAWLNHPNIARLIDGGATADGRPYFVMEYIDGQPITEYVRKRNLSIRDRLKLFRGVCAAVTYAHGALIVHRDLKPGNILVTNEGTVKLLDFGLAKVLDPALEVEKTATLLRMLTPAYASPEQIRGEQITVASDIYSLGVILYELLSGSKPYDVNTASAVEAAKVICEAEPPPPSEVAGTMGRPLKGDLDVICLTALRKDPQRRYTSVDEFSEDIGRHLDGHPIKARPDTLWYRVDKFLTRHRAVAVVGTIAVVGIAAGLTTTIWQARQASRHFDQLHHLANSIVFEIHDAIADLPGSTKARALLVKRAVAYLDALAKDAGNDVELRRDLATAYMKLGSVQGMAGEANLGDRAGAETSIRKALAILEALHEDRPNDGSVTEKLIRCYNDLSEVLESPEESLELAKKGFKLAQLLAIRSPGDDRLARLVASTEFFIAQPLIQMERYDEAYGWYARAMAIYEDVLKRAPGDRSLMRSFAIMKKRMGGLAARQKKYDEAVPLYEAAYRIDAELLRLEPTLGHKLDLSFDISDLGYVACQKGDHELELARMQQARVLREEVAKADPNDERAKSSLASIIAREDRALDHVKRHAQGITDLN